MGPLRINSRYLVINLGTQSYPKYYLCVWVIWQFYLEPCVQIIIYKVITCILFSVLGPYVPRIGIFPLMSLLTTISCYLLTTISGVVHLSPHISYLFFFLDGGYFHHRHSYLSFYSLSQPLNSLLLKLSLPWPHFLPHPHQPLYTLPLSPPSSLPWSLSLSAVFSLHCGCFLSVVVHLSQR